VDVLSLGVPTEVIKVDIALIDPNSNIIESLPYLEVKERIEIDTMDAYDIMGPCDPSHGLTLVAVYDDEATHDDIVQDVQDTCEYT